MYKAFLVQNVAEYPSYSMRRYSSSLSAALRQYAKYVIEMPSFHQSKQLAATLGNRNASRWARMVSYPNYLRKSLDRHKPEVCHVLDHSHANLLRCFDPAKSVITVHDVIPMLSLVGELDFRVNADVRYTFPRKLRLIERCQRVIAISECTKQQLLRFVDMPADRIKVVHYGVSEIFCEEDRERSAQTIRERYGIASQRRVLLHVCTRNRYKNTPALLHMLSRLPDEFVLIRVGDAMFEDEQALTQNLGVNRRLIEAGRVERDEELAEYYRAADVFVFPSTFEGFGWPPLEAMACGTPVVTSNVASLPEVVGAACPLVEPHDYDALARTVADVVEHRNEYRTRSLKRASQFRWRTCAEKSAVVYDEVVAESRKARI